MNKILNITSLIDICNMKINSGNDTEYYFLSKNKFLDFPINTIHDVYV